MTDAKTVAELAAKGTQGDWEALEGYDDTPIVQCYENQYGLGCITVATIPEIEYWEDLATYDAQRIANVPAMEALIAEQATRNAELEAENARLREYISKDAPRIEHLHRQSCLTLSGTQMMALDTWVGGWIYEARAALEGQGDE